MSDLIELPAWQKTLANTDMLQPLAVVFDGKTPIEFELPPGWNIGLAAKDEYEATTANVVIDGTPYALTKSAINRVGVEVGLSPKYIEKTPGLLIASHLNYWAAHAPETMFGLLTSSGVAVAAVKKAMPTFPNSEILEPAIETALEAWDAQPEELAVDFKSHHDLDLTVTRVFNTTPTTGDWCYGMQITNSLTGRHTTGVEGYLFLNDGNDNGVITTHSPQHYNRRMGHDLQEVLDWVPGAVVNVLDSLEYETETITGLEDESLGDSVPKVLADVFRTYKVPLKVRSLIMDALIESGDQTYYGVVMAISHTANTPDLKPEAVTALMQIAGALAHDSSHRCKTCQQVVL